MLDGDDAHGYIAQRSLEPLLVELRGLLGDHDVEPHAEAQVLALVARVYITGHRDGQREATGQIAAEASRHGIQLRLAPELVDPDAGENRWFGRGADPPAAGHG